MMPSYLAWPLDPSVYAGLAALLVGYLWLAQGTHVRSRQRVWFAIGVAFIWLALETPLDTLGDTYLQSAHMTQHMLLMAFAPPFLLLGLNRPMVRRLHRVPGLRRITEPVPALLLYTVAIIGWHLPGPFDLALANESLHVLEHLSFLACGVLFWWPMIKATSAEARWSLSDPQKLVLLFFGSLPMMAVALPLQFAGYVFYAPYVHAPRINAFLTPVVDQTVAGAVMMFMDMSVMAADGLIVFFRWFNGEVNRDFARSEDPSQSVDSPEDQEALEAYLSRH